MKSRKKYLALLAVVFAGILAGGRVFAQDSAGNTGNASSAGSVPDLQTLSDEFNALSKASVVVSTEHNYLDLATPDKSIIFKVGGLVDGQYRNFFGSSQSNDLFLPIGESQTIAGKTYNDYEEGATAASVNKSDDTFLDRRVRLDLIGLFDQVVGFRYQGEFGGSAYAVQDAYAFIKADPALQLQIGQFKVPIGLERLQNDSDLLFAERGLPTDLVPNRDYGALVGGNVRDLFLYSIALTNGTPDNWTPTNANTPSLTSGNEVSGRIFLTPFHSEKDSFFKDLGLGVSGGWTWDVNWNANAEPNYFVTSLGQQQFFAYHTGVNPSGEFSHLSPQGYFYTGSLGILGEYVSSTQDVGTSIANGVNLNNQAWQVEASYVIGGKASFQGSSPDQSLDLSKGRWGALEVAGRVGQVIIDPKAFSSTYATNLAATNSAQQATDFGAGLNWVFDTHFKLVFDFDQTTFVEGAQVSTPATVNGTVKALNPEDVFTVAAQASF